MAPRINNLRRVCWESRGSKAFPGKGFFLAAHFPSVGQEGPHLSRKAFQMRSANAIFDFYVPVRTSEGRVNVRRRRWPCSFVLSKADARFTELRLAGLGRLRTR